MAGLIEYLIRGTYNGTKSLISMSINHPGGLLNEIIFLLKKCYLSLTLLDEKQNSNPKNKNHHRRWQVKNKNKKQLNIKIEAPEILKNILKFVSMIIIEKIYASDAIFRALLPSRLVV